MSKCTFPIRDNVLAFEPYSPGLSIEEIKQRFAIEKVVKLASNENPLGASPLVQKAIKNAASSVFRYAQSGSPRLVHAIATHYNLSPDSIVIGNGSDEVIDLIIRACPTPSVHNVVISNPSFSLYRLQSKLCGVTIKEVPLEHDFSFNFDGLLSAIDPSTAIVFITMPDNPSGYCPTKAEIEEFIQKVPSTCLIVLDEAYADFITDPQCSTMIHDTKNIPQLVVLRTFSKSYGLAGLRLGYGVMNEKLAACLKSIRPPFSVNILVEEAGIAALTDTAFRQATMETVHTGRIWLAKELKALHCHAYPTQANFIMFTLPKGLPLSGKEMFEKLLAMGIIIRPLGSYGLDNSFRVSIGTHEENQLFIEKLKTIITHA